MEPQNISEISEFILKECPFPLSLRYEDIKKALKIFFGMAVIEGLIVIGLKKSSFLANCKAFEPEFNII